MKKFKKTLPFALAAVMLLLGACGATTTDDPPAAEDPPNYEQPVTLPGDIYDEDPPNYEQPVTPPEDIYDEGPPNYEQPVTPPEDIYDEDADYDTDVDIDYEWPAVIVDGVGVQGSSHRIVGDDIFPNYVSLEPVAQALGAQVSVRGNSISLQGLSGGISFEIGSADFAINGTTVALDQPALEFDGVIYVPIPFFRDVFGAGSAFFSGGEVHISADGGDMM
jgi:hypothetical protein